MVLFLYISCILFLLEFWHFKNHSPLQTLQSAFKHIGLFHSTHSGYASSCACACYLLEEVSLFLFRSFPWCLCVILQPLCYSKLWYWSSTQCVSVVLQTLVHGWSSLLSDPQSGRHSCKYLDVSRRTFCTFPSLGRRQDLRVSSQRCPPAGRGSGAREWTMLWIFFLGFYAVGVTLAWGARTF